MKLNSSHDLERKQMAGRKLDIGRNLCEATAIPFKNVVRQDPYSILFPERSRIAIVR
ncbi:MAG TPA: hypothetical protein V6C64_04080 [Microcoleaceae cyanobacterium]